MKKLAIILILSLAFFLPLSARAQGATWVALQSDSTSLNTPGQIVNVSLSAMLNTAINGASLILHYDPACFKIARYEPGSLLPGATAFAQEQPGQLDLTYYFQGKGQGLTGEGSLITIQLETLKLCTSDVSVAPETITLGVLDDKGLAFNLPGVEYHEMMIHMVAAKGLPAVTPQPTLGSSTNSSIVPPPSLNLDMNVVWIVWVIAASLLFGLFLVMALFFLLRSRSTRQQKNSPTQGPALAHAGGTVLLPHQRTQLGRHIEIVRQNGEFYVVDSGSRLGVFLNGIRLGTGYYQLSHGDLVQLGREVSYKFINARQGVPSHR